MGTREQNKKLIIAARQGKLEGETGCRVLVSELLKMACDLDFVEKPFFRPAMWEAAWKNHEAIVKLLVEKGAAVNFADCEGRTALHEVCYYGHMGLCEYLLEKGAEIDKLDKNGQTPLFRAVTGGRHDIVSLLVDKGAKTNLLDSDEVTIQHCSAFLGEPHMSWWLYYKGSWQNRYEKPPAEKAPEPKKDEKKEETKDEAHDDEEAKSPTEKGMARRGSTKGDLGDAANATKDDAEAAEHQDENA